MKKQPKSDNPSYKLTRELRLRYIADDVVKGMSKRKIGDKYSEQWGISKAVVYDYYREALVTLTDEEGLAKLREVNTERLLDLYQKAIDKGDVNAQLKAIDLLNKTNSIYQTNINFGGDTEFTFSFGEVAPEKEEKEEDNEDEQ